MDSNTKKINRLTKLVREVETFNDFKAEVIRWPKAFGVPLFTEKDYQAFYDHWKREKQL